MGDTSVSPIYQFIFKRLKKNNNMEFKKKNLRESLEMKSNGVKTYSEKPQNIIMTESQLERLIEKLNK